MSRHSPILLELDVGAIPTKQKESSWLPKKPAWYKATMGDIVLYKEDMQDRLQSLAVPDTLGCSDPKCSDSEHSSDRDSFVLDILCSIVESTHSVLPLGGGRRANSTDTQVSSGNIPGWTENVQPFRELAIFWHSTWVSAGKPNRGELHGQMASSRNQYHYAVRRTKRQAKQIKAVKLFEASLSGDIDLLKEMKNIKCGKKASAELPDNVAGANGESEIVEKFKEVYKALYNSSGTQEEMEEIKGRVSEMIRADSMEEVNKVTSAVVKEAASLLKAGKTDVSEGFTSDAILNGPDLMYDQLASVYRSC